MRELIIGGKRIADDTDCYVIAEVGHNHQGELEKCKDLFRVAKECGADAVKLQKRDNRTLFTKAMYAKPYDHENSFGQTYGEHREFLEFGRDEYLELIDFCRELDITLFSTAFDIPSADFIAELDLPAIKIASGDLRNIPLLKHAASLGKPLIISTGGADMADIERAYRAIMAINTQLAILQCTATYPTPAEEMNLLTIPALRERFQDVVIGLSDHYNGILMGPLSYIMGSRIIEKHFTLNHTWKGSDHAMSFEPIGMSKLVRDLRRTRQAMGHAEKTVLDSERSALQKMGKTIVAAKPLPSGHVLTEADVAYKSPGGGLWPYQITDILGKTLSQDLDEDEFITLEMLS